MLRINAVKIDFAQNFNVPFNIEQAVNVDPIGDYNYKDGIDSLKFKRDIILFLQICVW